MAEPQDVDVGDNAERLAAQGWRVVPIAPGEKYPRGLPSWQTTATDDLNTIRSWWQGDYRNHGVGIVCGADSALWVLDVDISDNKNGSDTLALLISEWGPLPETIVAHTGGGGLHYYFAWPDELVTNGNARHLGPGLDIRGEGGFVVAPPTIHPNGRRYEWWPNRDPWSVEAAQAPSWLMNIICPPEEATRERAGIALEARRPGVWSLTHLAPADWAHDHLSFRSELERAGWQHHSAPRPEQTWWTRPGKEPRLGHSAVLHANGPLVVFTTEAPELEPLGLPTSDGSAFSISLFDFVAATRFNGDRQACARWVRSIMPHTTSQPATAPTKPSEEPEPISTFEVEVVHQVERLRVQHEARIRFAREQAADREAAVVVSGDALFDVPDDVPAIWGRDVEVLWAQGEPMVIVAPSGVGKTTLMGQVVMGLCGIERFSEPLGYPVRPGDRVLYVAADRPQQIMRSLRRHIDASDQELLADRLRLWQGPPPSDLASRPETLLDMVSTHGATHVVLDSLKDMAAGLTEDTVANGLNRALQLCIAEGIEVAALHHQRKGVLGEAPKKLEDVYGSTWITAGVGSVLLLWGEAGSPLVELVHLKQPAETVGPMRIEHDHRRGVSHALGGWDPLVWLRGRGLQWATATEAATAMTGKSRPSAVERTRARRHLERLAEAGLAERELRGRVGGSTGEWFFRPSTPLQDDEDSF